MVAWSVFFSSHRKASWLRFLVVLVGSQHGLLYPKPSPRPNFISADLKKTGYSFLLKAGFLLRVAERNRSPLGEGQPGQ